MLKRTKIQKLFVQFYSNKNKGKTTSEIKPDGEQEFNANDFAPVLFYFFQLFSVNGETS
jgi:hypothetical protein